MGSARQAYFNMILTEKDNAPKNHEYVHNKASMHLDLRYI